MTTFAAPVLPHLDRSAGYERTLPILKNLVAIPAFWKAGHDAAELPTVARFDREQHVIPFDVREYPDVLAALRAPADEGGVLRPGEPLGVWTTDLVRYDRAIDHQDLWSWILRRFGHWTDEARRRLYLREAKPVAILERLIAKNIITDNGATTMLKVFGSAAPSFFNHLQMSADAKTLQLSATAASAQAACTVAANGTNFTNTMVAYVGYGLGTQETKNVSSSTATSVTMSTNLANTHNANEWLVQAPGTQTNNAVDNPSAVTSGYDSGALAGGAFTYSGTGPGNRQVQVAYNFPSNAGAPGGGYTDLWLSTAATIAAGTTGAHLTRSPLAVNGTTGANVTYTETV